MRSPPDESLAASQGPVTVIVRRRIRPECREQFEAWLRGIIAATARFEGHLGTNVLRPDDPATDEYVVITRFDDYEHLCMWERSEERASWLERVVPLTVGTPHLAKVTGLEFWFPLPQRGDGKPPPSYKMAVVTVLAIYPLVLVLVPWLTRVLAAWPGPLATLAISVVLVVLMTWIVMPLLTRVFARWLYPRRNAT